MLYLDSPGEKEHGCTGPDGRHVEGLKVVDDIMQYIQTLAVQNRLQYGIGQVMPNNSSKSRLNI